MDRLNQVCLYLSCVYGLLCRINGYGTSTHNPTTSTPIQTPNLTTQPTTTLILTPTLMIHHHNGFNIFGIFEKNKFILLSV